MQSRLSLNWMALALRGVAAIVFGVIVFVVPGIALGALILLFAALAIVDVRRQGRVQGQRSCRSPNVRARALVRAHAHGQLRCRPLDPVR
jgi:hypothetical protein